MNMLFTSEERKMEIRKRRRQIYRHIAFRVIVAIVIPISIATATFIGFVHFGFSAADQNTFLWFVVALSVYIGSWLYNELTNRDARIISNEIRRRVEHHEESIDNIIKETLSTHIEPLGNRQDVLRAVADLMSTTATAAATASTADSPYLIYFGAAAVAPTEDELKDAQSRDDLAASAAELYGQGLDALREHSVPVHRYVNLFSTKTLPDRSKEFLDAYVVWLKNQIAAIKANSNFVLYNAERAPRWKAIRSFVVSPNSYVDILGDGESGIRVYGPSISAAIRINAERYLRQSRIAANRPERFGQEEIAKLEKHCKEFEEAVSARFSRRKRV